MNGAARSAAVSAVSLATRDLALRAGERVLLDGFTQTFGPGEIWCIAGPNGAGKTTLISTLAGVARPASGRVELDGVALARWSAATLARRRALMPQTLHDAFSASVLDVVLLNRFPHLTGWGWETGDDVAAAHDALAALGLAPLAARDVLSLSGGERQRVALAGVLCQDAPLLLLDEPLAHLDLHHQIECLDALTAWARRAARTVLFSCHDLNLGRRFATHALLLDGRGGAQAGRARDVLTPAAASRAFGYPLVLIRDGEHEALIPALQSPRPRAAASASEPMPDNDNPSAADDPVSLPLPRTAMTLSLASLPAVAPLDPSLRADLQHLIDNKTKPPGSLGQLEALALQIGLIQNTAHPTIRRPAMIVFAGDHGIAAEGVSPYPQAVTVQMVANFLAGGAAINAFSRVADLTLEIVDAGIATPLPDATGLVEIPVGRGTRNFAREPAMTRDEALAALAAGGERVRHHAALGTNVIGFGEMGISNTSSAACLMSRLCDVSIGVCVGRGTGLDDAGVAKKRDVLATALARHADAREPLDVLATFGGFEIAMMAGAFIAAAAARMVVLVDGFIATSALLVADALVPGVRDYCVFSHASNEAGHRRMLEHFGATPLLALDLRLGEGTGAALAVPLLRAAVAFVNEMASFESAGVATRDASMPDDDRA